MRAKDNFLPQPNCVITFDELTLRTRMPNSSAGFVRKSSHPSVILYCMRNVTLHLSVPIVAKWSPRLTLKDTSDSPIRNRKRWCVIFVERYRAIERRTVYITLSNIPESIKSCSAIFAVNGNEIIILLLLHSFNLSCTQGEV